uniref:Putative amastin-like protein n=2 Tax=Leishmania guyanensis species complex TaxID=38579 RepID=A0A1E1J9H0_LEIGU|nr:Putative amastin-like protein [Leishmania guyanensis]
MVFTHALLLYVIVQFIAFLFVLVGTPIDMFHQRGGGRFENTPCITLWGSKDECHSGNYSMDLEELWRGCPARQHRFRACQAFAIISIFVYGIAAVLGFLQLCCCSFPRWVCLALNVTGAVTLFIVWASMLVVYYQEDFLCVREKDLSVLGSGFALLVIAWLLDALNILFLLLLWPAADPSKSKDPSDSRDPSDSMDAKE